MMRMDPKKLINQFSWKRSLSVVFSRLHEIHFADIWLVSVYTVTYKPGEIQSAERKESRSTTFSHFSEYLFHTKRYEYIIHIEMIFNLY